MIGATVVLIAKKWSAPNGNRGRRRDERHGVNRLPVRGGRFFFAGETPVSPFMLFWAFRFLPWRELN